ncbi:Dipeptide transport system permease DppB [Kitasatospora sp. MMS16-BH015]|uniref:ABC transporter permease n=1 Tax=Kitasatospora sp. MMS16-BH015 TaxID=2018025 RepID=UPI000CA290AA|nr:ABC transporter permease [Kitasatospora sp. MMS16-BH015]AUG75639.1 Dipeptide transport system permease DppB [Kitasatospora sp. MMS16-BH015]
MGRYLLRRLGQMVVVLLGATLILFACLFVIPGDPVGSLAGSERARDPAVVKQLREHYGLDKPLAVQYVTYIGHLAQGDMGEDYIQRRPVSEILGPKLVNTSKLAVAAIVFDVLIGAGVGALAALRRYSIWDTAVTLVTTVLVGFPTFVIGMLLLNLFAVQLKWVPVIGDASDPVQVILPAITLAVIDAALVARLMRGTMLEVLRADYVKTAIAKGVPRRQVLLKHVLRNSVIPVVTYIGISFGSLLGGAIITETIFNWDGVGMAMSTAIQQQNNPVVVGVATWGVGIFVVLNLVVDLMYAMLDPRIRLS